MRKTSDMVFGAVIAAFYVILTLLSAMFGLSGGVIQVRLSEALTILPIFTPAAVPGLFAGCLIANLITGCAAWDVIFGSLATLLAAILTRKIKDHGLLASVPPVAVNTLVVPWILSLVYSFEGSILYFGFTVFIGEFISAGVLGQLLRRLIESRPELEEKIRG